MPAGPRPSPESVTNDAERSDQISGQEEEGPQEEVARGNSKQLRAGLAEKLNTSGAHGIMGQKI